MIIKKRYAQSPSPAPAATSQAPMSADWQAMAPPAMPQPMEPMAQPYPQQQYQAPDPYQGPLAPEDFESGIIPDRRRTERRDRRQAFRRIEDHELISRAHEEANAIREVAAVEGFEEGLNQAQAAIDQLSGALQEMLNARETALLSAGDELAALAIEIAERIIKTEVACDDELVMSIVKGTIARVGREQKSITVKVNPIDVRTVREHLKADSDRPPDVDITVVEDESVDQGSCMVETQAGLIDARFSTQLQVLRRMVLTGGKF